MATNSISNDLQLVGFVQDPNGRGTSSLVTSCLLTLVLCVWSALHLNVPRQGQTLAQSIVSNVLWIITGIYAPELVVFTAWRQYSSAKLLQKKAEQSPTTGSKRYRYPWTISHSFFACTGGFTLEVDDFPIIGQGQDQEKGIESTRLTLTARGAALLAEYGLLPDVAREEIQDKSKANALAKATVIVQASWMLLQVMGRLSCHLTVTLLEVNTVAHVLCAFAMYLFWWDKPLLPKEPIVIRDPRLRSLAAYMYMCSEMSGVVDSAHIKAQTPVKTFFAYLNFYSKTPEIESIALLVPKEEHCSYSNMREVACSQTVAADNDNDPNPTLKSKHTLLDHLKTMILANASQDCKALIESERAKTTGTAFFERRPRLVHHDNAFEQQTSQSTQARWELAADAIRKYNLLAQPTNVSIIHSSGDYHCIHLSSSQLVAMNIQNWPWDDLLRSVDGMVVGMILWLANLCYGSIHAAAWNEHFPSSTEKWLWRASACYIGFCGGLWVVLNALVSSSAVLNEFWEKWMDGEKTMLESVGLGLLVFVCGVSLILARVFLVVEAFVSIRELPAQAYMTPQWTNAFPHF